MALKGTVKLKIRRATPRDMPAILSLYAQPDMDDDKVLSRKAAHRIFARMNSYPSYRLYVAAAGKQTVGTFALLIMDNLAHLGAPSGIVEDVVVRTDWQGRGIGKQMMEFAMRRCRERRCYKLALSSNLKRIAAHRFYESLGFKPHGYSFSVPLSGPGK